MIISIKLYICKHQEKYIQEIINNELLPKLIEQHVSYINPINTEQWKLYERYEIKNNSIVILYISIPIIVDKKQLLTEKVGYNYITKSIFTSKHIAKYLQRNMTNQVYCYFYQHENVNMKSTSLKHLHVTHL